jgi:hypothetical protein
MMLVSIPGRRHIKLITDEKRDDGKLTVKIECPTCPPASPTKHATLYVNEQGLINWANGELIQNALPDLLPFPDLRERLMTGTCTVCWDEMFGPEEFSDDDF